MSAYPRKPPPPRRILECQRHTERLLLRVPPGTALALDGLAAAWACNRSEAVARLVRGASGVQQPSAGE